MTGLIADIGGTNARFATVDARGNIHGVRILACSDFPTLASACEHFIEGSGLATRPRRAAIAVASPVLGDHIRMTNHIWEFSIEATRQELGFDHLDVVNDFAAVALSLPHLLPDDIRPIGGGTADTTATMAAIGPGTGLGMAGLIPIGDGRRRVLPTEGGHVTLPACDDREAAVISALRRKFGHVSAERVISGPGIVNLYHAIAEVDGIEGDPAMTGPEATSRAIAGSCPICMEALAMFAVMLGTITSNLALMLDTRGGIFLAGGILPSLGEHFPAGAFRQRFEDKGRFREYLSSIPTVLIERSVPAFVGLAALVNEPR